LAYKPFLTPIFDINLYKPPLAGDLIQKRGSKMAYWLFLAFFWLTSYKIYRRIMISNIVLLYPHRSIYLSIPTFLFIFLAVIRIKTPIPTPVDPILQYWFNDIFILFVYNKDA
jgi:hypothetical protein